MKKLFTCREITLTHEQMLKLPKAGILNLGINHELACQVSESRSISPKKTTAAAANKLWNFVGVAGFLFTIFLSFTVHWWWFLIGFVAMGILGKANMKGNSENLLDAATIDRAFYERVRAFDGWLYPLEEAEAHKYRTASVSPVTTLAAPVPASGRAHTSPSIDMSAENQQALQTLAAQGQARAQFTLGTLYGKGQGVPQDYAMARQWWEQAATQGDADAQYNLGVMYDSGLSVPQDDVQARQWYEQAAAQGHANAQYNLGLLYDNGQGVPQDNVRAYMWLNLAAASPGPTQKFAEDYRDEVARHMTPAQVAEAQQLSQQCQARSSMAA